MLAIQGIGYLVRKGIAMASVSLDINQYQAPPKPPSTSTDIVYHIDIEQTAAGLSSTHERRCIDGEWRDHQDWLFGEVKGRTWWTGVDGIDDEFLRQGWEADAGELLVSHVESKGNGWTARQVWGFQVIDGVRRYARNVVVTKGSERAAIRLVYNWVG